MRRNQALQSAIIKNTQSNESLKNEIGMLQGIDFHELPNEVIKQDFITSLGSSNLAVRVIAQGDSMGQNSEAAVESAIYPTVKMQKNQTPSSVYAYTNGVYQQRGSDELFNHLRMQVIPVED